jgi:hypothetical protein
VGPTWPGPLRNLGGLCWWPWGAPPRNPSKRVVKRIVEIDESLMNPRPTSHGNCLVNAVLNLDHAPVSGRVFGKLEIARVRHACEMDYRFVNPKSRHGDLRRRADRSGSPHWRDREGSMKQVDPQDCRSVPVIRQPGTSGAGSIHGRNSGSGRSQQPVVDDGMSGLGATALSITPSASRLAKDVPFQARCDSRQPRGDNRPSGRRRLYRRDWSNSA